MTPDEILAEAFWVAGKTLLQLALNAGETSGSTRLAHMGKLSPTTDIRPAIEAADQTLSALFQDEAFRWVLAWAVVGHCLKVNETLFDSDSPGISWLEEPCRGSNAAAHRSPKLNFAVILT